MCGALSACVHPVLFIGFEAVLETLFFRSGQAQGREAEIEGVVAWRYESPAVYDSLLWGERQIRSVANMTRADARDFLELAAKIGMKPQVTVFPLDQANEALAAVKKDQIDGAAVITI